jgi:hypothetical protein
LAYKMARLREGMAPHLLSTTAVRILHQRLNPGGREVRTGTTSSSTCLPSAFNVAPKSERYFTVAKQKPHLAGGVAFSHRE